MNLIPEVLDKILTDYKRLIEQNKLLVESLKKARKTIAGFPRSMGYDITDLSEIDALLKQLESENE